MPTRRLQWLIKRLSPFTKYPTLAQLTVARIVASSWPLLRRSRRARLSQEEQRVVAHLGEAIREGRVMMLGPIRQEILSGIREKAQFAKTERLLEPFPDEMLETPDYAEAARLFNLCRDHGVQCGPVEMLLCAAAARRGCEILTSDQGLLRCVEILRANKVLPGGRRKPN
jgi:predicted nucleic acid-binding protein